MSAATDAIGLSESTSYDRYVRAEWVKFAADAGRQEGVGTARAGRILDVGCGAGQELRPYLRDPSAFGIGLDISPEAGLAGRALFASEQQDAHVAFARAAAESLPLPSSSIDLVICRLVLPYTDNARALAEIARVLRPGGVLLLRVHHARYYAAKLADAIRARRLKPAIHACRVLVAGACYQLTGVQPRNRLTGSETFQTLGRLRRLLEPLGLTIRSTLPDSEPAAMSLLIDRPP